MDAFTGIVALVILIFVIAFFWFVPVGLWIAAIAGSAAPHFRPGWHAPPPRQSEYHRQGTHQRAQGRLASGDS